MAETEDRWAAAELYRVRGELLRAGHDPIAAERCYFQAIDIARQQSAKSWELRAAISLARLWRDQGKRDQARDLLAPDLQLVHGRLRHGGPAGCEGAARRASMNPGVVGSAA